MTISMSLSLNMAFKALRKQLSNSAAFILYVIYIDSLLVRSEYAKAVRQSYCTPINHRSQILYPDLLTNDGDSPARPRGYAPTRRPGSPGWACRRARAC